MDCGVTFAVSSPAVALSDASVISQLLSFLVDWPRDWQLDFWISSCFAQEEQTWEIPTKRYARGEGIAMRPWRDRVSYDYDYTLENLKHLKMINKLAHFNYSVCVP